MDWVRTFVSIFAIVDPITALPIFLSLTTDFDESLKNVTIKRVALFAGGILLINALIGDRLFRFFGISMAAFQIAGGLLMLLLAVQQLFFRPQRHQSASIAVDPGADVSVFPLALPVLAGPGALSTVTLLASRSRGLMDRIDLIVSIILIMVITYIVFKNGIKIYKKLGSTGIDLFMRLMAVLLAALAVQFIIDGLKASHF